MPAEAALKHWITMLAKHHFDQEKLKAHETEMTIEEFLAKSTFHTLEAGKAQEAIDEMMKEDPELEEVINRLYREVLDEIIADDRPGD
ncbi:hypothetical protein [Roseospirillum parvum]|uniref:Uncharacterized protein n=1 Tax=Roseospirillum parvum TaxID=83401 RepID=A0A1G8BXQ9_9PROT|nr:hypothetical protein [Roseospirillum parvum]SDH38001.1 hypothetical protein SAMN05421742_106150 [Roseospirillum parvum]